MNVKLIALLSLTIVSVSPASANLLSNGSFESPSVPNNTHVTRDPGSTDLTGWTILSEVAQDGSKTVCCGYSDLSAEDGQDFIDLTGDVDNGTGGLEQTVATTIGDTYSLSYQIGNASPAGTIGATSTVKTSINGVAAFSDTNSTAGSSIFWEMINHSFVATSGTTTIAFLNGDPSGDNLNGLDNVILTDLGPPSAAVPEPASWALMLVGFGGTGAAIRCSSRCRRRFA